MTTLFRKFNNEWKLQFLFEINNENKPECLVCGVVLKENRKANINRHYDTKHPAYKDVKAEARSILLSKLQLQFNTKNDVRASSSSKYLTIKLDFY